MQEKKDFFNSLQKLIEDFDNKGIKETATIALVYQVAFKILESTGGLIPPIHYSYTELNINKEIAKSFQKEVQDCSMQLIAAIVASEPFSDLVAEFIEDNEASNKNLGQYFTPNDVSLVLAELNLKFTSIDKFTVKDDYYFVGDDTGCGTGSLILALLSQIKSCVKGFEDIHYQSIAVTMNDIDEYLSKIAYFQVVINSILHHKPLGVVQVEAKDIIKDYLKVKNMNIFISNTQKFDKYKLKKKLAEHQEQ